MKRAAPWYPPRSVIEFKAFLNRTSTLTIATVALASLPVFAQRAGGGRTVASSSRVVGAENNASTPHVTGGVQISAGDGHLTGAAKSSVPSESSKASAGTGVVSGPLQSEGLLVRSAGAAPDAATQGKSADKEPPARRPITAYPQKVVIGFPPSPNEFQIPSETLGQGKAVVTGQRNEFWAEAPQRAAAPRPVAPQHAGAPIRTTAPPVTTARPIAPSAPGRRWGPAPTSPIRARRPLWFLQGPAAVGPPHVFGPRRGRPRLFGGFGFFPFGFGSPFFNFGFAAGCNPFWAWPWGFGCETFGYWNGYTAGFYEGYNASLYRPEEQQQEMEQAPEEPQTYTYVPPPEPSSPEEIEAEKILVVLYMKNGAVYAVTNYWVADGKLHYLTSYGGENTIDLDDLDLQKTVDVNATRGVEFTLKPAPQNNPQPPQDQPNPPDPQD